MSTCACGMPLAGWGPGVGVDLLLCQEHEYAQRSQVPGQVLYRAPNKGKVLHDALR
jgi:hypothetical protein